MSPGESFPAGIPHPLLSPPGDLSEQENWGWASQGYNRRLVKEMRNDFLVIPVHEALGRLGHALEIPGLGFLKKPVA